MISCGHIVRLDITLGICSIERQPSSYLLFSEALSFAGAFDEASWDTFGVTIITGSRIAGSDPNKSCRGWKRMLLASDYPPDF